MFVFVARFSSLYIYHTIYSENSKCLAHSLHGLLRLFYRLFLPPLQPVLSRWSQSRSAKILENHSWIVGLWRLLRCYSIIIRLLQLLWWRVCVSALTAIGWNSKSVKARKFGSCHLDSVNQCGTYTLWSVSFLCCCCMHTTDTICPIIWLNELWHKTNTPLNNTLLCATRAILFIEIEIEWRGIRARGRGRHGKSFEDAMQNIYPFKSQSFSLHFFIVTRECVGARRVFQHLAENLHVVNNNFLFHIINMNFIVAMLIAFVQMCTISLHSRALCSVVIGFSAIFLVN